MPDRGVLDPSTVEEIDFETETALSLGSACWVQVTFEVERQAAVSCLPCEVGRPVPPYARLLVADSRAGSLALLSAGGRYRLMPRNVVVQSVAHGLPNAEKWLGSGGIEGEITLSREHQRVTASVAGPDGPLATITLPDIYAIEPSMLRWDGLVATGRSDGRAVLAELMPTPEIFTAYLCKGAIVEMSAALPRSHPWRQLRSLGTISACYVEGTLSFGAPQIQETWG